MKQRILIVVMILMIALSLMAGCGKMKSASSAPKSINGSVSQSYDKVESDSYAGAQPEAGKGIIIAKDTVKIQNKIIYTCDISLQAKNHMKLLTTIAQQAAEMGGYVASSDISTDDSTADSTITLRIPPGKQGAFITYLSSLGKITNQKMGSQDITDQYYDQQARLTNALAQEAQLLDVLKTCKTVSDTLKVREQLNTIQGEIEVLKGQIRLMDNQVDYSTINLRLSVPVTPAIEKQEDKVSVWAFSSVWAKAKTGFVNAGHVTLNVLYAVLIGVFMLAIPAVVILLLLYLIFFKRVNAWFRKKFQSGKYPLEK